MHRLGYMLGHQALVQTGQPDSLMLVQRHPLQLARCPAVLLREPEPGAGRRARESPHPQAPGKV